MLRSDPKGRYERHFARFCGLPNPLASEDTPSYGMLRDAAKQQFEARLPIDALTAEICHGDPSSDLCSEVEGLLNAVEDLRLDTVRAMIKAGAASVPFDVLRRDISNCGGYPEERARVLIRNAYENHRVSALSPSSSEAYS